MRRPPAEVASGSTGGAQLSAEPFDGPGITDSGHGSRVGARSPRVASLECVIDRNGRSHHGELGAARRPTVGSRARVPGIEALEFAAARLIAEQARNVLCDLDVDDIAACLQFARRQNARVVLRARSSCEMSGRCGSARARCRRSSRGLSRWCRPCWRGRVAGRDSRCAAQEGRRTSGCS